MNPSVWFRFIADMLRQEAEVIAAFIVGFVIPVIAWFALRHWFPSLFVAKDESTINDLRRQLDDLQRRFDDLQRSLDGANATIAHQQTATERERSANIKEYEKLREEMDQVKIRLRDTSQKYSKANENTKLANDLLCKKRDENQNLKKEIESLNTLIANNAEKTKELSEACEALKDQYLTVENAKNGVIASLQRQLDDAFKKSKDLQDEVNALDKQIDDVERLQGRLWEKPVKTAAPFRKLEAGKPPIIAVANLKGGVGKTSLTANLAATLACQGSRVLVIDLDHQGSLTRVCLPSETFADMKRAKGRFIQDVLASTSDPADVAWRAATPVQTQTSGEGYLRIIATDEGLADVEEHLKAQWMTDAQGPDIRFILRSTLHDSRMQAEYDIILLDCPPRLTTACINALACCDYVLIPVVLDGMSVPAVPRFMSWLKELMKGGICHQCTILGVVANRTFHGTGLTADETSIWQDLKDQCKDVWGKDVFQFKRFVPHSQIIMKASHDAGTGMFAAFNARMESVFSDFAKEVQRRLKYNENSRAAAVR